MTVTAEDKNVLKLVYEWEKERGQLRGEKREGTNEEGVGLGDDVGRNVELWSRAYEGKYIRLVDLTISDFTTPEDLQVFVWDQFNSELSYLSRHW